MSLYSKKLHIKKPNGVVQIANLYTDKSDVGNNYLTFRDGGNTIYSVLDVNGDIDCKINKNNVNYKIRKENTIVPNYKVIITNKYSQSYFTIPNGVNIIFATFNWNTNKQSTEKYLEEKLKTNDGYYIKVTPNKTYEVYNNRRVSSKLMEDSETDCVIGNFYQRIIHGIGVPVPDNYYEEYYLPVIIAWSSEINSHAINGSAD